MRSESYYLTLMVAKSLYNFQEGVTRDNKETHSCKIKSTNISLVLFGEDLFILRKCGVFQVL